MRLRKFGGNGGPASYITVHGKFIETRRPLAVDITAHVFDMETLVVDIV